MWVVVVNGVIAEAFENPKAITVKGIQYPRDIFLKWPEEDLAKIGIFQARYTPAELTNNQKVLKQDFQVLADHVVMYDVVVTATKEEVDASLVGIKNMRIAEVIAHHHQVLLSGFIWEGKQIPLDTPTLALLALRGIAVQANRDLRTWYWVLQDNTLLQLSRDQMLSLVLAAENQLTGWVLNQQRHIEHIQALDTPKAVVAYDATTGW